MKSKVCIFSFSFYLLFALPAFCFGQGSEVLPVVNYPEGDYIIRDSVIFTMKSASSVLYSPTFVYFDSADRAYSFYYAILSFEASYPDFFSTNLVGVFPIRSGRDGVTRWSCLFNTYIGMMSLSSDAPEAAQEEYNNLQNLFVTSYGVKELVAYADVEYEAQSSENLSEFQTQVITLLEELPLIKESALYTFICCALLWGSVLYISFMQRR